MSALSDYYLNLLETCEETKAEYEQWLSSTFDKVVNPVSDKNSDTQNKEKENGI
jgi:hypothetical protein